MARKITVLCDPCKENNNKEVLASICDFAFRLADPEKPEAVETVRGTVEVCAHHQQPFRDLAAILESFGTGLDQEARKLLTDTVQAVSKTSDGNDQVLCMECSPPKLLKLGSTYSHSDKIHGKRPADTNYQPYAPGRVSVQ